MLFRSLRSWVVRERLFEPTRIPLEVEGGEAVSPARHPPRPACHWRRVEPVEAQGLRTRVVGFGQSWPNPTPLKQWQAVGVFVF